MSEEVLDRRTVYAGRLLNLEIARVRLPNRRETEREVVRHPGAVAILPLIRSIEADSLEWQVLLLRQYRFAAGRPLIEVPAGTIQPGEEPLETARRELAEEAGRTARVWHQLARFYPSPGYSDEMVTLYLALELEETQGQPEEDEAFEELLMPITQAREAIRSGEIEDAKTMTAILLGLDWLDGRIP